MRPAVRKYFIAFSEPLEGIVPHMYVDSMGFVTVGMGNLIEPITLGADLPWMRKGETAATTMEYVKEWNLIKNLPNAAKMGWTACTPYCNLHLTHDEILALIYRKMEQNEVVLKRRVPNFDSLCADAQLMLHSWAWAVGPEANYPLMLKYINRGDFIGAAEECTINPQVGTIIKRNAANKAMLKNAASSPDPERLVYVDSLEADAKAMTTKELQAALNKFGFKLDVDGVLGVKTKQALKGFQNSHNLKVDGIPGPITWAAIRQALRYV